MAYENPSPLVVEFQTKFYFQIWFNVMKYVEAQAILRFGSTIFKPKQFFYNWSLHTEVLQYISEKRHPLTSTFFLNFGDFINKYCQAIGI